jgi:hypothetical protein
MTNHRSDLPDAILRRAQEIAEIVGAMGEPKASRRPEPGAWSAREIVSHLCQTDNESFLDGIGRFVLEEKPEIEVTQGVTHYTPERHAIGLDDLVEGFLRQYELIADYVARLGDEQLGRRAHIALFRDTPAGEYPTLAEWVQGISEFHLQAHLDELRARRSIHPPGTGTRRL